MSDERASTKGPLRRFIEWLGREYHFLVYRTNLEHRRTITLQPWQVFLVIFFGVMVIVGATAAVIAFTSLREYIPGYSDLDTRRRVVYLMRATDSLQQVLDKQITYLDALHRALYGRSPFASADSADLLHDSFEAEAPALDELAPAPVEIEFQRRFENTILQSLRATTSSPFTYSFFPPVEVGYQTAGFDPTIDHYAIDLATPRNAVIRSVAAGRVVFRGYTPRFGNVVVVHHVGGIVSIFKHCATILVKEGTFVEAGTPIATVGSTGELSTGPHLHFELWADGVPINPAWFIKFDRNVWQKEG